jgi:hypothetical protein
MKRDKYDLLYSFGGIFTFLGYASCLMYLAAIWPFNPSLILLVTLTVLSFILAGRVCSACWDSHERLGKIESQNQNARIRRLEKLVEELKTELAVFQSPENKDQTDKTN